MLFYRILSTPPELDKELSGLLQICTSLSQTEHVDSQHMLRGVSILTSFRYNLNKKKKHSHHTESKTTGCHKSLIKTPDPRSGFKPFSMPHPSALRSRIRATPDFNFLLMPILEDSGDGSRTWIPTMHNTQTEFWASALQLCKNVPHCQHWNNITSIRVSVLKALGENVCF